MFEAEIRVHVVRDSVIELRDRIGNLYLRLVKDKLTPQECSECQYFPFQNDFIDVKHTPALLYVFTEETVCPCPRRSDTRLQSAPHSELVRPGCWRREVVRRPIVHPTVKCAAVLRVPCLQPSLNDGRLIGWHPHLGKTDALRRAG